MSSLATSDLRIRSSRCGPLKVSYRHTSGSLRLVFAVPKSTGTAVTRNRARRRVRAAVQDLQSNKTAMLGDGEYRISILSSLKNMSPDDLRVTMLKLLNDVQR